MAATEMTRVQAEVCRLGMRPAPGSGCKAHVARSARAQSAFTLMETLVVVGIIALFVGIIGFGFLRGSANATVGLQASQSILVGLLTQARSQAILTGQRAGLFIHFDLDAGDHPERYLRFLVPAVRNASDTDWVALDAGVTLPEGCVVIPRETPAASWIGEGTSVDWSNVRSTALDTATATAAFESNSNQRWLLVSFTPRGTVSAGSAGNIGVARSRIELPGAATPFKFVAPRNVRGVALSSFGQARVLNSAGEF